MRLDAGTPSERIFFPRNPWPTGLFTNWPLSRPIYAPAKIIPNMETPTRWTPYGTFVPTPVAKAMPYSMMSVPQADFYDSSPNPFPANGVDDQPNARFNLLRLRPSTSAHPGSSLPTGPGPTMVFHAPPVFGLQTTPIYSVGV